MKTADMLDFTVLAGIARILSKIEGRSLPSDSSLLRRVTFMGRIRETRKGRILADFEDN